MGLNSSCKPIHTFLYSGVFMQRQVFTYDPLKQGQQKGISFLRNVYGFSYRKALSVYAKIRYQIAQKMDVYKTTAKELDVFVTKALLGESQIKTKAIVSYTGEFEIKYGSDLDPFKQEVARRLEKFKQRYEGSTISEIIDEYLTPGSEITYDELKDAIEEFKQNSPEHLRGS